MSTSLQRIFKSLSGSTRIDIVKKLLTKKEFSCQELSKKFTLSQPALSHHFNKLIEAKIINMRKEGVAHYYSVNDTFLRDLGINIRKMVQKGTHI